MNATLWILQGLFALLFVFHGSVLLRQPPSMQRTLSRLPFSEGLLRLVGACELLGGLGLVLPGLLGIGTMLTPLAAGGLALVLAGASSHHIGSREPGPGIVTGLLSVLLLTVALGRSAAA